METLNYKVLESTGYNGYILKDAPVKVMQFGEGNFLRAFVDYFFDIANEKAGYNGKVKLVQPIANFPQMADWINEQEGLYTGKRRCIQLKNCPKISCGLVQFLSLIHISEPTRPY